MYLFLGLFVHEIAQNLTVGLLVAGTGTRSSELLGLAATRVCYQQGTVIGGQNVLDLLLGCLIHICKTNNQL